MQHPPRLRYDGHMVMSKSVMKRLEVQRAHVQPKVPVFSPNVEKTRVLLEAIIAEDCGERSRLAYAALTHVCTMMSRLKPGDPPRKILVDFLTDDGVTGEYVLSDSNDPVDKHAVELIVQLFPGGVGLPALDDGEVQP